MNLVFRQVYGNTLGSAAMYNTYILGVSSVITSASILATRLGISTGVISNFTIVGSDVKCKITGNYTMTANAFYGDQNLLKYYDNEDLVTELGNYTFYDGFSYTMKITDLSFKNAIIVGSNAFTALNASSVKTLKRVVLSNATTLNGDNHFRGQDVIETIYIGKVTTLGATVGNNNIFTAISPSCKIYCHPSLATNNSGGVDGDIAVAISLGCTIRYVSSFVAPNPVTSLSVGSIYSTAVQLNFTAPTGSTNAYDFSEVYKKDVYGNWEYIGKITNGGYAVGLSSSTTYDLKVVARDIYYNGAETLITATTNITSFLEYRTIAAYHLSDGVDSKNGYNGTVGSSVTFGTGINVNAATFNGATNSYISIPDNNAFSFTNGSNDLPFSIAGWLKTSADGYIFAKAINAYNNGGEWAFQLYAGNIYFRLQDKTTTNTRLMFSFATPFNNTTFKHFAITYDGSKTYAGLKFYVNGVQQIITNQSAGTYVGCANTSQVVYIGGASDGTNKFSGSLDELCFFNAELTQVEIINLQSSYYPF